MSSWIDLAFLHRIARAAAAEGLDEATLLEAVGATEAPLGRVASQTHYALWEEIMRRLPTSTACGFPIRYGESTSLSDYGVLGLALKTAPTVADAIHRIERYLLLLSNSFSIELTGGGHGTANIVFHRVGERRLGMRCANEAAIGEVWALIRAISTRPIRLEAACFRHRAPASTTEHQRWFACPLRFGSGDDALVCSAEALDYPTLRADDALFAFVLGQLEQELERRGGIGSSTIESQVTRSLVAALPSGPPDRDRIARELGMSPRTLHRRLAAQRTSFREVVEDVRDRMARHLLSESDRPLSEIAFLAGFSEQSAFHRAFKRWTGQTPAAYREGARGQR